MPVLCQISAKCWDTIISKTNSGPLVDGEGRHTNGRTIKKEITGCHGSKQQGDSPPTPTHALAPHRKPYTHTIAVNTYKMMAEF